MCLVENIGILAEFLLFKKKKKKQGIFVIFNYGYVCEICVFKDDDLKSFTRDDVFLGGSSFLYRYFSD